MESYPPNAKLAFCVPAPAKELLAICKAPPVDQEVPSYSSVQVLGLKVESYPPIAKPASCVPVPPNFALATCKAPPVDQEVPLYSSVHDTIL